MLIKPLWISGPEDSPIRCTPEEIKRKHKLAREKLLAKRQLPFTSSQCSTQSLPEPATQQVIKNTKFQPRLPTTTVSKSHNSNHITNSYNSQQKPDSYTLSNTKPLDIKSLIEKKRQEALMKLRRRQPK